MKAEIRMVSRNFCLLYFTNRVRITVPVFLDCHTREGGYPSAWIPAFAGMTGIVIKSLTKLVLTGYKS